uniref:Uncharacterized protein n=1 Tax=Onchocerca volvulus TaxID=6282 RepID=A0A8R1XRQ0_ONCVO
MARRANENLQKLHLCIDTLEIANDKWFEYIQKTPTEKRRNAEEEKYEEITKGNMGLFRIIKNGKEVVITLKMYKNEIDRKLSRLSQEPRSATESSNIQNIQHMII